ncbi:MAG: ParA family protein [Planctomycetota bacterium]
MTGPASAPVIVVGCHKGGIGRTVLAVNLAAMLALSGRRTLLIDLDQKGDATASVGLPRARGGKSLARFSEPWSFLKDTFNAPAPPGLDVWPGGPGIERIQREMGAGAKLDLLERGLTQARRRYRAVVIDAPSELGPLARNALVSGDVLLLPVSPKAHVEQALGETIRAALEVRQDTCVYGVRVESRAPRAEEELADRQEEEQEPVSGREGPFGVDLLECTICYDADTFEDAAQQGRPVFEAAPHSRAARCFLELGREVLSLLDGTHPHAHIQPAEGASTAQG